MDRVMITGGTGFIGRHLVKKILSSKPSSIALVANTSNMHDNFIDKRISQDPTLKLYIADIRDRKVISDIFQDEKADTCIHLAAKISVADSIKNPDETMDINVKGTLNVLEACHNSGVDNFVFASSAAVYGDVRDLPISEMHTLDPLSPYGKSKMLAEQHVLSYNKSKKVQNTVSLRIFNVYGQGQTSEIDVITRFAARLSKGLSPIIYGNGKQTRDFISIDDVVDAILLSIRSMEEKDNIKELTYSPVFNIGTGIPTGIEELAQKMIRIFGLDVQPIYEEGKDGGGIMQSYANMTKAKEILHFVPKKAIDVGLREIIGSMHISSAS
jgi:UDP-glucose 4-epimerase